MCIEYDRVTVEYDRVSVHDTVGDPPGRLLIPFSLLLGAPLEKPNPVLFTPIFALASISTGLIIPDVVGVRLGVKVRLQVRLGYGLDWYQGGVRVLLGQGPFFSF